jgi:hypothetical protein
MMRRVLLVVLAGLLAAPVAADARPRRRGGGGDLIAQRPGAPATPRREKAKARIRAMRALILAEELELDEATSAKLAPVLNHFDDELASLLQARMEIRERLRAAEAAGDDRAIQGQLDALVQNQDRRWDLERQRFADLRKVLTPRQAARLVDVLPEIDRKILKGIRERRQQAP